MFEPSVETPSSTLGGVNPSGVVSAKNSVSDSSTAVELCVVPCSTSVELSTVELSVVELSTLFSVELSSTFASVFVSLLTFEERVSSAA